MTTLTRITVLPAHLENGERLGFLFPSTHLPASTGFEPCRCPPQAFQVALVVKEPACQSRRRKRCRFSPRVRRSPGGGHGNPLQCSCLENPVDRGAFRATVHRVAQKQSDLTEHICARTHTRTDMDTDIDTDLARDGKGLYLSFTSQPLPICNIVP